MQQIIKKPLVSEKSYSKTAEGKFSFLADPDADKELLREMIEELYKVNVVKINTSNVNGKVKRVKGKKGKRNDYKKFTVTLKPGQKIALFDIETEEKKSEPKAEKKADKQTKKQDIKPAKSEDATQETAGVKTTIKKAK